MPELREREPTVRSTLQKAGNVNPAMPYARNWNDAVISVQDKDQKSNEISEIAKGGMRTNRPGEKTAGL
jgi:hypothetical protein